MTKKAKIVLLVSIVTFSVLINLAISFSVNYFNKFVEKKQTEARTQLASAVIEEIKQTGKLEVLIKDEKGNDQKVTLIRQ